jgi:transposase
VLKVVQYQTVRNLHYEDGWSIKRICRELHRSRKFVRKAIKWEGETPHYQLKSPRPKPVVTPEVEALVRDILVADKKVRLSKQRHSADAIHKRLVREKHPIGRSTVRLLVRRLREELREHPAVTVPLYFAPGEEAQVDWGEADVIMKGETVRVQIFHATLCYSRRTFLMAFPHQNQESFLEGHVRAFEHWGGTVCRLAYDNLRAAVKKILIGGEREENPTFTAFRVYYHFDHRYCTPGIEGAHEKGRVERRVDTYREDILVPPPEVDGWEALNSLLLAGCLEADDLPHPDYKDKTVAEVFEEERSALGTLPAKRHPCCKIECFKADGHARVRYDHVQYSLPCEYGRRRVEVRAFFDRIEFYDGVKLIRSWSRCYTPGEEKYDYRDYLRLLKRAPGACLNGKPYLTMPEVLLEYRQELLEYLPRRTAGRTLARTLLLILEHGETYVLEAVELAMLSGTTDAEAVKSLVEQLENPPLPPSPSLDLNYRPGLHIRMPLPDLTRYDRLVEEETYVTESVA